MRNKQHARQGQRVKRAAQTARQNKLLPPAPAPAAQSPRPSGWMSTAPPPAPPAARSRGTPAAAKGCSRGSTHRGERHQQLGLVWNAGSGGSWHARRGGSEQPVHGRRAASMPGKAATSKGHSGPPSCCPPSHAGASRTCPSVQRPPSGSCLPLHGRARAGGRTAVTTQLAEARCCIRRRCKLSSSQASAGRPKHQPSQPSSACALSLPARTWRAGGALRAPARPQAVQEVLQRCLGLGHLFWCGFR